MKKKATNQEQIFTTHIRKQDLYRNLFICSPTDKHLGSCRLWVTMYYEYRCYGYLCLTLLVVMCLNFSWINTYWWNR